VGTGNFQGEEAAHCKVGIPSMCGGDAAFCQISLVSCCVYYRLDHMRIFAWNSGDTEADRESLVDGEESDPPGMGLGGVRPSQKKRNFSLEVAYFGKFSAVFLGDRL